MNFFFTIKAFLQKKDKIITCFVTKTFLRLKVYTLYLKQSISTLLDSIRETLPFYSEKQNSRAHRVWLDYSLQNHAKYYFCSL
jgi:hypothetical protein